MFQYKLYMSTFAFLFDTLVDSLAAVSIVIAAGLGYIGVGIILYGALKGFIHFVYSTYTRTGHIQHIRIEFAKHLSLGLEFLVGIPPVTMTTFCPNRREFRDAVHAVFSTLVSFARFPGESAS